MHATFRLYIFFPVGVEEQITWSRGSQREKHSAAKQMFDVARFRGAKIKNSRQTHSA